MLVALDFMTVLESEAYSVGAVAYGIIHCAVYNSQWRMLLALKPLLEEYFNISV